MQDNRQWWQLWVKPGCVRDNVHLAGVCFRKTTNIPLPGSEDGQTQWGTYMGAYERLTDEKVEQIARAMQTRFQRRIEANQSGWIFVEGTPNYIPRPEDEPLSKYLGMRRVEGPPQVQPDPETPSELEEILASLPDEQKNEVGKRLASQSKRPGKRDRVTAEVSTAT